MKLYTEEQVIEIMSKVFSEGVCFGAAPMYKNKSFDDIIKDFTPIELPSDDEIEKRIEYTAHNYFDMHNTNHYQGLKEGAKRMAKWVIDKIKKQQQ